MPRWLSAGRVWRSLSSGFGGDAPPCPAMPCARPLPDGGGSCPHAPLAVCWTGAASVVFRFRGTRPAMPCHALRPSSSRRRGITPAMPPLAVCWTGVAFVVFRFRGRRPAMPRHALRPSSSRRRGIMPACPAGCLLDGCGVRCLPVSGDAPRHALSCPAPVLFQTAGDHARMPRWLSRRQGTTGPGDALMVGIPAARLCF